MKPLINPRSRLLFLTGSNFGSTDVDDEHLVKRLNEFVGNLGNEEPHELFNKLKNVPYPDLDMENTTDIHAPSDILLKDTNRQNMGMAERFQRGQIGLHDLRKLNDIGTRYHWSMSRGLERDLVSQINKLDSESFNLQTIKPSF